MRGTGRASKAHTFHGRASERAPAALESISRNADASYRSRQVLKFSGVNVLAYLFQHWPQPPVLSKIGIDLPIPRRIVSLADERHEFRQLARRQRIHSILNFSQAHGIYYNLISAICQRGGCSPRPAR